MSKHLGHNSQCKYYYVVVRRAYVVDGIGTRQGKEGGRIRESGRKGKPGIL